MVNLIPYWVGMQKHLIFEYSTENIFMNACLSCLKNLFCKYFCSCIWFVYFFQLLSWSLYSFVILRFQYFLVFQLPQMAIFRCSQSCTLPLYRAWILCKIRNRLIVGPAFMLFLFSHIWGQLLDFHQTLLFLWPTTYPRKLNYGILFMLWANICD